MLTLTSEPLREPPDFPGMSFSFRSFFPGMNEQPHDTSRHLALKNLSVVAVKTVECGRNLKLFITHWVGDLWLAKFVKQQNLVPNPLTLSSNFLYSLKF